MAKPVTSKELATGRFGQYAHVTPLGVTDATLFVTRLIDEVERLRSERVRK